MLVGRDEPVEPLVPELVDGHGLDLAHAARGHPPRAARRDERRVLHATGLGRVLGRVHDREVVVRVLAEELAEPREAELHRVDLDIGVVVVALGVKHAERHAVVGLVDLLGELVPRGEGEVVHVALYEAARDAALVALLLGHRAARADDEALGHVDRHVVVAEVRIKLGEVVEREVRPRPVGLAPRDLREPLPEHVEAPRVARAEEHRRELLVPRDLEGDALAGLDRLRQGHAHVSLVVGVAGRRRLGRRPHARGPLLHAERFHAHPAPVGRQAGAAEAVLDVAQEHGALVLERVQIEVQPQLVGRDARGVRPADLARALELVELRIDGRLQRVARDVGRVPRHGRVVVERARRGRDGQDRLRRRGRRGRRSDARRSERADADRAERRPPLRPRAEAPGRRSPPTSSRAWRGG